MSMTYEQRQARDAAHTAFLRSKPEPMATAAEVLAVGCPTCGVEGGVPCEFSRYPFSLLGLVFRSVASFHTRRYQAASGDTR